MINEVLDVMRELAIEGTVSFENPAPLIMAPQEL